MRADVTLVLCVCVLFQERSISLGERALRKVVGRVNKRKGFKLERLRTDGESPPATYFDLALFSCCCCVSPLGLIALILAGNTQWSRSYISITLHCKVRINLWCHVRVAWICRHSGNF